MLKSTSRSFSLELFGNPELFLLFGALFLFMLLVLLFSLLVAVLCCLLLALLILLLVALLIRLLVALLFLLHVMPVSDSSSRCCLFPPALRCGWALFFTEKSLVACSRAVRGTRGVRGTLLTQNRVSLLLHVLSVDRYSSTAFKRLFVTAKSHVQKLSCYVTFPFSRVVLAKGSTMSLWFKSWAWSSHVAVAILVHSARVLNSSCFGLYLDSGTP